MKNTLKDYISIIIWSSIFALSCNLFIVPFNLYGGGIIGLAQVIRTLFVNITGIESNIDLTGITNLLININILRGFWGGSCEEFLEGIRKKSFEG